MKCLVLGGCGFIGSHLVDGLLQKGHRVVVFDRTQVDLKNIKDNLPKIELIRGDFSNREDVNGAIQDVDYIFHFVGTTVPQSSTQNPIYDIESNVIPSIQMLEIAKSSKIRKIIFASSGGTIYGIPQKIPIPEEHSTNPICAYGISKLIIEKYLQLYYQLHGLEYVILRFANAYGERQDPHGSQGAVAVFLGNIMEGKGIDIWGDGTVVRDYIHVSDIVCACLIAMEIEDKNHRVFNIGSGSGVSLNQLIEIMRKITGKEILVKYSTGRKIDVPVNILDISMAKDILAWRPKVPIKEGVRKTLEYVSRLTKS